MVLPDKLLRVGLALGMHLPSHGQGIAQRDVILGGSAVGAAAGQTDLVRFHSTLKIARGIVEEQKRAEMMEVPKEGLVSILNRIKELEDEVLALMNGNKQALSAGGESSAADPTGDAAGGEPTFGVATVIPAGGDAGGEATGSPAAQSTAGSDSSAGSAEDSGTSGGKEAKPKPSESADAQPTNGAIFSEKDNQDDEDDCAPEKLLYHLGGASLQKRGNSVSGHPLFRRNANCTLDNMTGSKKVSPVDVGRPDVTPIGSAAAENQETSSADTEEGTAAPAAGTQGTSNAEDASGDEPLPTVVDVDGKTLSVETVAPSQLADEADDPPPAVVTAGDSDDSSNSNDKSPSPSAGGVFKEEEYTTVVVTSTKDRTTTMTMTKTKTRTIHLKSSPRPDSANAKFADNSLPASAAAEASSAATAPSTDATDAADKIASSAAGKPKGSDNASESAAGKKAVSSDAAVSEDKKVVQDEASDAATSTVATAEPESTTAPETEASDSAVEPSTTPAEEKTAAPDAETPQIESASAMTSQNSVSVGQEQKFNNNTVKTFPPVAEHITIPSTLLEGPTPFESRPAVTPAPLSRNAKQMFTAFINGTFKDTRSSGFKTIPTMREEVPVTEAQQ